MGCKGMVGRSGAAAAAAERGGAGRESDVKRLKIFSKRFSTP